MPFHEAARQAHALDRELVAAKRRIDAADGALIVAEIRASERLRSSVSPPPVIAEVRKGEAIPTSIGAIVVEMVANIAGAEQPAESERAPQASALLG